jgi:hypothetical protein
LLLLSFSSRAPTSFLVTLNFNHLNSSQRFMTLRILGYPMDSTRPLIASSRINSLAVCWFSSSSLDVGWDLLHLDLGTSDTSCASCRRRPHRVDNCEISCSRRPHGPLERYSPTSHPSRLDHSHPIHHPPTSSNHLIRTSNPPIQTPTVLSTITKTRRGNTKQQNTE